MLKRLLGLPGRLIRWGKLKLGWIDRQGKTAPRAETSYEAHFRLGESRPIPNVRSLMEEAKSVPIRREGQHVIVGEDQGPPVRSDDTVCATYGDPPPSEASESPEVRFMRRHWGMVHPGTEENAWKRPQEQPKEQQVGMRLFQADGTPVPVEGDGMLVFNVPNPRCPRCRSFVRAGSECRRCLKKSGMTGEKA